MKFPEIVKFLDEHPELKWKNGFSPAEQLGIIALRPVLPVVGGRIALMLEMALDNTTTEATPRKGE